MSFTFFSGGLCNLYTAPLRPYISTASFGSLNALGQIPISGITYNGITATYSVLRNGVSIATGLTASSYTYTGLANNTQYGPFTIVPYDAAGVAYTPFTVTGGNGGGKIYTWAYAGTLSFSGTTMSGTVLAFTDGAFSSVYMTYTPTAGVSPASGTKTLVAATPITFSGMTAGTTYSMTAYPVNGDNVPGSASGTNTSTGSVTTLPSIVWVAVGSGTANTLAYSTDGVTWTGRGKTVFSTSGYDAAYGNGIYIAGGQGTNLLAYSKNGVTWTGLGSTFSTSGRGAAYGNGLWVAAGQGTNSLAYSKNGVTWTGLGSTFSTAGYVVAYGNGLWVAGGSGTTNTLAYSKDGVTWTGLGKAIFTGGGGAGVAYANGLWVATGDGTNSFAYSTNGVTWTGRGITVFSAGGGTQVAYANGLWVAAGNGANTLAYSTDGITWAGIRGVFSTGGGSVAYGSTQNIWVAGGSGTNTLAYSTDGLTWTGRGLTIFGTGYVYGVAVSA